MIGLYVSVVLVAVVVAGVGVYLSGWRSISGCWGWGVLRSFGGGWMFRFGWWTRIRLMGLTRGITRWFRRGMTGGAGYRGRMGFARFRGSAARGLCRRFAGGILGLRGLCRLLSVRLRRAARRRLSCCLRVTRRFRLLGGSLRLAGIRTLMTGRGFIRRRSIWRYGTGRSR